MPPNALLGSHLKAAEKLFNLSLTIDTPQGFVCFIITVPVFFGRDLLISSAANISL